MPKEDRPALEKLKRTISGKTTEENKTPNLIVGKEEASLQIESQIKEGEMLRNREINSERELQQAIEDCKTWSHNNGELLLEIFDSPLIEKTYNRFSHYTPIRLDTSKPTREKYKYNQFMINVESYREWIGCYIDKLIVIHTEHGIHVKPLDTSDRTIMKNGGNIFIGHGRSQDWLELKKFLNERLKLQCDEFDRVATAGLTIPERLKQMLEQACMAFLIMTAEDEQPDGTQRARENVVHEVGLFQGRLGFEKAIILLEEDCKEFSNIHGLIQIRFPKGNIKAAFEEIRQVLEREGLI